jgi:hypothetical protein
MGFYSGLAILTSHKECLPAPRWSARCQVDHRSQLCHQESQLKSHSASCGCWNHPAPHSNSDFFPLPAPPSLPPLAIPQHLFLVVRLRLRLAVLRHADSDSDSSANLANPTIDCRPNQASACPSARTSARIPGPGLDGVEAEEGGLSRLGFGPCGHRPPHHTSQPRVTRLTRARGTTPGQQPRPHFPQHPTPLLEAAGGMMAVR